VENDGADQEAKDIAHTLFDVALVGTGLTPNDPAEFASRVQVLMRLGLGVSKDAPIEEPEVVLDPEPEKKDDKKADDKKEADKNQPKGKARPGPKAAAQKGGLSAGASKTHPRIQDNRSGRRMSRYSRGYKYHGLRHPIFLPH